MTRDIHSGQSAPLFSEWNECRQQFPRVVEVIEQTHVIEGHQTSPDTLDIGHHIGHRPLK